jgi:two-component system, response regulator / RNA-binding antiterminator
LTHPSGTHGAGEAKCYPAQRRAGDDLVDQTKILIIDENPIRAAIIEEGLREGGHDNVEWLRETQNLLSQIAAIDPDVIVIDLGSANRDVLEQMFQVSRLVKRPIAMFVDQSDSASTRDAMIAGVSAYVVDGLKKERVKPILDMCISRFHIFTRLQEELQEAKTALSDRKIIERAKGILMARNNLAEQEAYALLRKAAMNEKRRISEIAKAIIMAESMLK